MSHYVKLFGSILDSTVWQEPSDVRIVWITMLAMADQHGEVEASIPGLARRAGVPVEACERAIKAFMSPDPYSRTRDFDGRRIEEMDGGWRLLNHDKYRDKQNIEDIRERAAERQRRYIERKKASADVSKRQQTSANVSADENDTNNAIRSDQIISEADHLKASKTHKAIKAASAAAVSVLDALNAERKRVIPGARTIGANPSSLEHIEARLADGYTVEDCQHVIRVCASEVAQNPVSAKWFNTVSPFRKDNFARKLGGSPDTAAATGHARDFGDNSVVGDMTETLGDWSVPT